MTDEPTPPPDPTTPLPPWHSLLTVHLVHNLQRMGFRPEEMHWRWAIDDLNAGWPYGVVVAALEATQQSPSVPYSLAKVNQAHVALMQLEELRRTGVI